MKQCITFQRKHHGFSLVEVLASMLILGVGLIGVAKFQTKMAHESLLAKQQSEAINIAEAKLESLRFAYAIGDTPSYQVPTSGEPEKKQGTNTEYQVSWDVLDDDTDEGQAEIKVHVIWDSLGSTANSDTQIVLKTIASDFDPNIQAKATYTPPTSVLVPDDINTCTPNTYHRGSSSSGSTYCNTHKGSSGSSGYGYTTCKSDYSQGFYDGSSGITYCSSHKGPSGSGGYHHTQCQSNFDNGSYGSGSSGLSSTGCSAPERGISFGSSSS